MIAILTLRSLMKALEPTKKTSQASPTPSMKTQSFRSAMKALMMNDVNRCMCSLFLGFLSLLKYRHGNAFAINELTFTASERELKCSPEEGKDHHGDDESQKRSGVSQLRHYFDDR